MNNKDINSFAEAFGCNNMREVCEKAANWNFNISEEQHFIRSAILSLHANIEGDLKHILFHHMVRLINDDKYQTDDEPYITALIENIKRLSFSTVLTLLQPCLDSADHERFSLLRAINSLRNAVAHREPDNVLYKGRNPFQDHDSLAELLSDTITIHSELGEFFTQRIALPPDGLLRQI